MPTSLFMESMYIIDIPHYPPLQESQVYLVTNWVLNLSFWIQNKDAWILNDAEQALVP